jgi:hypothetical protein
MSAAKPRPLKSPRITLEAAGRPIHVPVRLRSVIERLNRKLAAEQQRLHKTQQHELGPYYFVAWRTNSVIAHGIDEAGIEAMARQQGALRGWEEMTP